MHLIQCPRQPTPGTHGLAALEPPDVTYRQAPRRTGRWNHRAERIFAEYGRIESGYNKQSKVETTFHRYKSIVGPAMRARGLASQRIEARVGCRVLNTMAALGMPDGQMIG